MGFMATTTMSDNKTIYVLTRVQGSYSDRSENILCAAYKEESLVEPAKLDYIKELEFSAPWATSRPEKLKQTIDKMKETYCVSVASLNEKIADNNLTHHDPWYTVEAVEIVDALEH